MKIHVCQYALIAMTLLFLNSGMMFGATNTPPEMATPGTPAATDTKTQENNPGGTTAQPTRHPHEGTKRKKHKTHAPATQMDASGDKATKTPQKDTPPSTTNP